MQFKSVCSGVADSSGLLLALALDSQAEHLEPSAPLPGRFKDLDSRYSASSRPTKKKNHFSVADTEGLFDVRELLCS